MQTSSSLRNKKGSFAWLRGQDSLFRLWLRWNPKDASNRQVRRAMEQASLL